MDRTGYSCSDLCVDAATPHIKGYFHSWDDYAIFVLFVVFTLEAFARICVSGLIFDPEHILFSPNKSSTIRSDPFPPRLPGVQDDSATRTSSISRGSYGKAMTISKQFKNLKVAFLDSFALKPRIPYSGHANQPLPPSQKTHGNFQSSHPTYGSQVLKSDNRDVLALPFRLNINRMHDKAKRNIPYLRQSWTRIDFIAILGFWMSFVLAMTGIERGRRHVGLFRALSVMRTARLLTITSGTTTIMYSLKTARPLLTQVAYFVLFAIVLFSIIGVQSFAGSLRRTCVLQPTLGEVAIPLRQFCGGHIDPATLVPTGFLLRDGRSSNIVKGFICPLGQVCQQRDNPQQGLESFDAIWFSVLQVIIVASANSWSSLMYSMIDAEFWMSCFFFILAIIVLNFWLINLFVAVITNTFSAIRSQTRRSAFGAAPLAVMPEERNDSWVNIGNRRPLRWNVAKSIYSYTHWCWVLLAFTSLALQASRTVDASPYHGLLLYYGELAITIAFDFEIILRILASLPDWREFFRHGNNWLDLTLAIGSTVIQIPLIYNSPAYPWFTIFQLARFYRVILVVPRMKPLLLRVFGNMYALANMLLFLLLINYIAALVAIQLLRGDIPSSSSPNFSGLWNSFLAMYQVFSSENWTTVLYVAAGAEISLGQTIIVTAFITLWLLFANFLLLQMFIAVINENFEVAEESKRQQQASNYWATHQAYRAPAQSWFYRLNPYRWMKPNPVKVKVENLPSNLVLPVQKTVIQSYQIPRYDEQPSVSSPGSSRQKHHQSKSLGMLDRLFSGERTNDIPLTTLRGTKNEAGSEETAQYLHLLTSLSTEATVSQEVTDVLHELRNQKADFIVNHPSYDKTFWIFSQKNVLRRICQKLVQPANGERIFGTSYSPIAHPILQLIILLTVMGGIVVESIATPIYRRKYFLEHGTEPGAWFDVAESVFGFTLLVEFLIKIIADGFVFTPNAYILSIWNVLDFSIMVGILVNVVTGLVFVGGMSRFTRALKALRALRLITLIDKMRYTFESLILSGVTRILDAAVLAMLYMIPYAVWGLNIFAGKMALCNDDNVGGISSCFGEYSTTVLDNSFAILIPRTWDNPSPSTTFSFDTFRSSLLILFEIVSLEGWVDVMTFANSITNAGRQPSPNASQFNALFFLTYNLMGGVVILTLFVSIIIGNFKSKTGSAFLTAAQREWIDLQKLFRRQKPSKRPRSRPTNPIRAWCFDRAISKHGWWSRTMTFFFILQIVTLMTQTFTADDVMDGIRNNIFLGIIFIYISDVFLRLFGLGWNSFCANGWNLFDIVVTTGSLITTLIVRSGSADFVIQQLQKLFFVSIAFKLVQRFNALNMLFKTAVASLPVILSLLGLWLILFVFFGILYVEVFGLTKWGQGESRNQNYTTMGSALVMLAFMSVGEGWNQYMHDYTISYPRCTNSSPEEPDTDCGSSAWALSLAIAWNLLSMYIFLNMFTGVVVENFSYVFQSSGGGAKSITREQMRSFKKVWAEFANAKTGYLERSSFVPFFRKLGGAFEVRIYPDEHSIPNILDACTSSAVTIIGSSNKVGPGFDLTKLNAILDEIDYSKVRKRKAIFSRLYHEARISHSEQGISFTQMLFLLAHHKLIIDGEALTLKDLVARTQVNKLVTDLINLDRVRSLLKALATRRRYLNERQQRLSAQVQDIPSIVIDTLAEPLESPMLSSNGSQISAGESPSSPVPNRGFQTPDISLALDHTSGLQRSNRRTSDISLVTFDHNYTCRRTSAAEPDPQEVLSSMNTSMWSSLMLEAADEDETS